ncbi:MAG: hypothetical protein JXO44_01900 [Clostridia bacterium]|nr:hypothetical protein [Clostridia bacterium]
MKKISNVYRTSNVRLTKDTSYKGSYKKVSLKQEQVIPVSETNASSDRETNNHSLNMQRYYDGIKEQKEEYKLFYRNEQELEHDLKNIRFDDEYFIEKLLHLIHTYNHTILSLAKFDKSFNTNFSEEIFYLLKQYSDQLMTIGIKLLVDGELVIYSGIFTETVRKRRHLCRFLIGSTNSLFYKLYQLFQKVKIPQLTQEPMEMKDYVGTIIDAKG